MFFASTSVLFAINTIFGYLTGSVTYRGTTVTSSDNNFVFWFCIIMGGALSCVFAYFAIVMDLTKIMAARP